MYRKISYHLAFWLVFFFFSWHRYVLLFYTGYFVILEKKIGRYV